MMVKKCISCRREIDETVPFCPYCGARQDMQQMNNQFQYSYNSQNDKMSTNKILSIVALVLSIVGIVWGGLYAELAALVISIVVLVSKERREKEAKTFAIIALVISIILIALAVIYLVLVGGQLIRHMNNIG